MGKVWVDMLSDELRADVIANYEELDWSADNGLEASDWAEIGLTAGLVAQGLVQHGFVGRTIYRVDFRWWMDYPEGGVWATFTSWGEFLPPWGSYSYMTVSSSHTIDFIAELATPHIIDTSNIELGRGVARYYLGTDTLTARVRLQRFLVEMDEAEDPCRWHRHRFTAEEC